MKKRIALLLSTLVMAFSFTTTVLATQPGGGGGSIVVIVSAPIVPMFNCPCDDYIVEDEMD